VTSKKQPFKRALNLRASKFQKIENKKNFDVLVIGGGTHGAFVALDAASRGYSVLLLEAKDYASGTSSRSSKLLHGGVRYLEQGHIGLVAKAIKERSRIRELAPHLSRVCPFLFCVRTPETRPAWQVRIGLWIYSFFNKVVSRKDARAFDVENSFRHISSYINAFKDFGLKFSSLLRYSDGQMDDARIVVEAIIAAENAGALCLNYSKVNSIIKEGSDWKIYYKDQVEKNSKDCIVTAKKIVNVTGPLVKEVHENCFQGEYAEWKKDWPTPVFSTGVHLFFDVSWPYPGMIIPAEKKGRYYFVLPLFSPYEGGTIVGTTDVPTDKGDCHPVASKKEIEQVLSFLKKDFPNSDLTEENLFHVSSGMRVMANRGDAGSVSNVSREEELLISENYIALLGGKYTTSRLTAEKIVDLLGDKLKGAECIQFPGAESFSEKMTEGCSDIEHQAAFMRFGGKARDIISSTADTNKSIQAAQIEYCIENEQVVFAQDLLETRLALSKCPSSLGFREAFEKLINKHI